MTREQKKYQVDIPDYANENVSDQVLKIILSYTHFVDRFIWRKNIYVTEKRFSDGTREENMGPIKNPRYRATPSPPGSLPFNYYLKILFTSATPKWGEPPPYSVPDIWAAAPMNF